MQKLTIITGLRQEGKTTELLESFIDTNTQLNNMKKEHNTKHTAVLLIYHPLFKVTLQTLEDKVSRDLTFVEFKVASVNNEKHLFEIMESHLEEYDADFFIDDVDAIIKEDTLRKLIEFSNSYPNDACKNSCDITCTYLRT